MLLKQKKNVKQFWRDIKKLGISENSKDSQIPLQVQLEDGNMSSERDIVLSKWMECFNTLLNRDTSKSSFHPSPEARIDVIPDSDQLNEPITRDEVIQALKTAPTNKAVGIDSIDPSYLQHESVINFLVCLFNYCFENGVCPSAWKKAVIFPIPKSGMSNKHIPGSYRGISLQSAVLKLYTSILNGRLMFLLETHEVISDLQNGFRPHRSCQDHILTLHNIVLNRKLKGNDTYACFVDFKKAFDSINRDLLWRKLSLYGIRGLFLDTLKSMYQDFECSVEVYKEYTPWFNVNSGVKQGCLLSPTLFSLFVNDLLKDYEACELGVRCDDFSVPDLAYADDIVLLASDPKHLQKLIDKTTAWCWENDVLINAEKTIMHFRHKRCKQHLYHFYYNDQVLDYCSEYKYLGYWINEHLDHKTVVDKVALAARRSLGSLIAKSKENGGFSAQTYSYLYSTLVTPVIDYSCCVWGYEKHSPLESMQGNAMRYFLGVGKNFPIADLYGDMGWIPVWITHAFTVIKWWFRLTSYNSNRIANAVFQWSMTMAESGCKNWCWQVNNF